MMDFKIRTHLKDQISLKEREEADWIEIRSARVRRVCEVGCMVG